MKKITLTFLIFNLYASHAIAASVFTIKNGDGPNSGFNNASVFQAQGIGGNYATTLGQARLNAIQFAANKLSNQLTSDIAIDIIARFIPMGGSASRARLAQASSPFYDFGFRNAQNKMLYPSALAEKIAIEQRNQTQAGDNRYDIVVEINRDLDGDIALGSSRYYYGFDASPPAGDIDFVTVIMHELIHGLGFSVGPMILSTGSKIDIVDKNTGTKKTGFSTLYTSFLEHHGKLPAAASDYNTMTNDQRFAANTAAIYNVDTIIGTDLHWLGERINLAAINNTNPGFQFDGAIRHTGIYAPRVIEPGSSVSHFTKLFEPNEMMEPAYAGPNHTIGYATQVLDDLGWQTLSPNSNVTDLNVTISNTTQAGDQDNRYLVSVINNGSNNASAAILTVFLPAGSTNSTVTAVNQLLSSSCNTKFIVTNRIVTCFIPDTDLVVTGSSLFVVTTNFTPSASNTISAVVNSLNPDSNLANNSISEPRINVTVSDSQAAKNQSGGCSLNNRAVFDPIILMLLLLSIMNLYIKKEKKYDKTL